MFCTRVQNYKNLQHILLLVFSYMTNVITCRKCKTNVGMVNEVRSIYTKLFPK